ncbi:hypothetical protein ES703_45761 [subsurface metagenome]
MAKQTAEITPGEVSQEQWDTKYDTTTKALKDMGGADTKDSDDLPEGAANLYDTGAPPATLEELADGATRKAMLDAEKTKLTGIEEGADANVGEEFSTAEQTKLTGIAAGAEVNPADLAALDPTQNTKLNGIDAGAEVNPTGPEIRDLVVAISEIDRKILITEPQTGEFKILGIHRNAAGNLEYDYDDVAEL